MAVNVVGFIQNHVGHTDLDIFAYGASDIVERKKRCHNFSFVVKGYKFINIYRETTYSSGFSNYIINITGTQQECVEKGEENEMYEAKQAVL
jgi:hypothetical protein